MLWVHKNCSGITKRLVPNENYACPRHKGESWPMDGRTATEVDVDGTILILETTFCYLGDMPCSCWDCDSAIAARHCVAWLKFRNILLALTTTHLSYRICGKVCEACVHSAMLHVSETWGLNRPELQWLGRNERAMNWWICAIKESFTTTETWHKW